MPARPAFTHLAALGDAARLLHYLPSSSTAPETVSQGSAYQRTPFWTILQGTWVPARTSRKSKGTHIPTREGGREGVTICHLTEPCSRTGPHPDHNPARPLRDLRLRSISARRLSCSSPARFFWDDRRVQRPSRYTSNVKTIRHRQ